MDQTNCNYSIEHPTEIGFDTGSEHRAKNCAVNPNGGLCAIAAASRCSISSMVGSSATDGMNTYSLSKGNRSRVIE